MICERLKQQQKIRPAVTTLERWVVTARVQAHQESLRRVQPRRTPERMPWLDSVLVAEEEQGKTQLSRFRQPANTHTPPAWLSTLRQCAALQSWHVDAWAMSGLNPHRQKCLARLGRTYTVQALRRMGPDRRYPLLLSFVTQTLIALTDESLALLDVCLASRHKQARKALQDSQAAIVETTEAPSHLFQTIGDVIMDHTVTDGDLRQAISLHRPRAHRPLAGKEAQALRRPNGSWDVLDDHDSSVRQCAPQLLARLACASHAEDAPLLEAIEVFRTLNTTKRRTLPDDVPGDFVPDHGQRFVAPAGQPKRRAYALCPLAT